jgi:hypothetical protein
LCHSGGESPSYFEPSSELHAIYQVLEETGYNLAGKLEPENVIELSIKEQRISLFVVPGVEEDFPFQTKTRKEISVSYIHWDGFLAPRLIRFC